ncbi:SLBB domain-containing protein [Sphingomonas sp. BIUV-7]|uniref:SLBB domain-containing protein n=1 Tax=Sphingomonas natans TaxID=3063330 RepID=A0ABT8YEI0_9SPHN|nr:SLBB domain-containing protein [Sphingomonas sp. BIUV-7]MDO6416069.1 SLBB domain-containing protein [Sphingomonas sp. BIUV-7]
MKFLNSIFAAIAIVCVAGQPALSVDVVPTVPSEYRVGPGDILKVTVYRAPDYDSVVQVAEDGTIPFSVIGNVKISGMTPSRVAALLEQGLRDGGIFKSPVVNVLVQEYHSKTVSVLGNVSKPGEYSLERGGLRLSDLLARAGATLGEGTGNVSITRPDGATENLVASDIVSGKHDRVAVAGETILIGVPPVFYISGEVQRSGSYPIEPGLTVGRAIALAGGLTPRGSRNKIKITRRKSNQDEASVKAKSSDPIVAKDLVVVGSRIF